MRRLLALGLVWLVAAVTAAVIAWQGVGLVGEQVTSRRPATLSAAQIEAALDTTATTAADSPTTTPPSPTTTAAPPASPSRTAGAACPGEGAGRHTFRVTGGTAALDFGPDGVTLGWARPDTGYEVSDEPGDGNGWRVEFEGEAGRSRIDGWWDGGPRCRVRDDAAGTDRGDDDQGDDDHVDDHG